jgi:hypothetical protein
MTSGGPRGASGERPQGARRWPTGERWGPSHDHRRCEQATGSTATMNRQPGEIARLLRNKAPYGSDAGRTRRFWFSTRARKGHSRHNRRPTQRRRHRAPQRDGDNERIQRLMLVALRSESVAEAQELRLIDWRQDCHHRSLDDLVLRGGDAQRPLSAIAFGMSSGATASIRSCVGAKCRSRRFAGMLDRPAPSLGDARGEGSVSARSQGWRRSPQSQEPW